MKRILIALFLSFLSLSAFADENEGKVYTRISGLYNTNNVSSGAHENGDAFCASMASTLVYLDMFFTLGNTVQCKAKWSNKNTEPFYYPMDVTCKDTGLIIDMDKFGCYAWKDPVPQSCPAAGTIAEHMKDEVVLGAYSNKICIDSCEIQGTQVVECLTEPDGTKYCNLMPPFTYTGKTCSTSEDGTGGGNDGDGNGEDGDDKENPGGGDGEEEPGDGEDGEDGKPGNGGSGGTGGNGSGGNGNGEGEGEGEEEGSSWGGDCKTGFNGEGDALAVAIAKAEWERNCVFIHNPKDTEEYKNYESLKTAPENSGEPGAILNELPGIEIDLAANLKDTNLLGQGACLADKVIAMPGGGSITLPYSLTCDFLKWLGYLFQGFAFITALRIAFGGSK